MGELRPLSGIGPVEVEALLDAAFGTDRHRRTAYLLRRGTRVIDHLSFADIDQGVLVGSIQCWPVKIAGFPLVLVGPVAVAPHRQNQRIGHRLMNAAIDAARPDDPPMMMVGDVEYYGRFGFSAGRTGGWSLPGPWEPHRLLLRNPLAVDLPETGMIGPRL